MSVYAPTPDAALIRVRTEFPRYEICRFHDTAGVPEVVAVLKTPYQGTGIAVLVCAATTDEITAVLRDQGPARLPRRDRTRSYWPPHAPPPTPE